MEIGLNSVTYISLQPPTLILRKKFIHCDSNKCGHFTQKSLLSSLDPPEITPTYVKMIKVTKIAPSTLDSKSKTALWHYQAW